MKRCSSCGIVTREDRDTCPLCGRSFSESSAPPEEGIRPTSPNAEPLPASDTAPIVLPLVTVFSLMASMVVAAVDLILNEGITWSRYPLVSILFVWSLTLSAAALHRRPLLFSGSIPVAASAFLLVLDLLDDGTLSWALSLGLPLIVVSALALLGLTAFIIKGKHYGYLVLGTILVIVAFVTTAINLITNRYLAVPRILDWALIVDAITLPLSWFFFYLHFGLKKELHLEKFFHL
ncbi:hypothetical protein Spith_1231 [Spirochaeta thermophila DSM 6578]|uniref:Uncharacterized protein n=1 Tax=Winmispira thermophila (strain ATCC 700085 / DSM 6578 / Z-1203) TaxID=869211 RepID=G0GEU1_WINT7|nr:DUF6320 domain-containing protein [Spirochaeta thermophila]AEJ61497.1 hypothetical protein Spith_1231 [Spirochaeta thermophila DSM 6578]